MCLSSSSGPDEFFLYEEDVLRMQKGTITVPAQENVRSETAIYTTEMNREEQLRALMNTETLIADLEQGKGKLIVADGIAKARRVSLVRSG